MRASEYFHFFVNGFDFSGELDKPNEFERYKACDVCFVRASQIHSLMQKKKKLVVVLGDPYGTHMSCSSPKRRVKRENDID